VLTRDRPRAYEIVRTLLPPGPASVIEFGCGGGSGRAYLGERIRYLGLERSRGGMRCRGVDVRRGFDWDTRTDIPTGFDMAVCLEIPKDLKPSAVLWKMGEAIREGGVVVVGMGALGDRDKLKRFFREVTVWNTGRVLLAACRGIKTGQELAA
jgi:hypothetical protein